MKVRLIFASLLSICSITLYGVTVSWDLGTCLLPLDEQGTTGTDYATKTKVAKGYLFQIDQQGYTEAVLMAPDDLFLKYMNLDGTAKETPWQSFTSVNKNYGGMVANFDTSIGHNESLYAVYVMTYDYDGDSIDNKFFMATAATAKLNPSNALIQQPRGGISTIDDAGPWRVYPVPEPTTVALLAIGVAAIGLKRKVA